MTDYKRLMTLASYAASIGTSEEGKFFERAKHAIDALYENYSKDEYVKYISLAIEYVFENFRYHVEHKDYEVPMEVVDIFINKLAVVVRRPQ